MVKYAVGYASVADGLPKERSKEGGSNMQGFQAFVSDGNRLLKLVEVEEMLQSNHQLYGLSKPCSSFVGACRMLKAAEARGGCCNWRLRLNRVACPLPHGMCVMDPISINPNL